MKISCDQKYPKIRKPIKSPALTCEEPRFRTMEHSQTETQLSSAFLLPLAAYWIYLLLHEDLTTKA